jgi:hypothetical protein
MSICYYQEAEFTVVPQPNQGVPENGLYIVFGWLFLLLFFPQKKEEKEKQ